MISDGQLSQGQMFILLQVSHTIGVPGNRYLQYCHRSRLKAVLTRLNLHEHHDDICLWLVKSSKITRLWQYLQYQFCVWSYITLGSWDRPLSKPCPSSTLCYPVPILVFCAASASPGEGLVFPPFFLASGAISSALQGAGTNLCLWDQRGISGPRKTAAKEEAVLRQGVPSAHAHFSPRDRSSGEPVRCKREILGMVSRNLISSLFRRLNNVAVAGS